MLQKSIILLLISICIVWFSIDVGLFWDNVLYVSKMGGFLYENSLLNWRLPDVYDPGHAPFTGFLMAIAWTLFGKSLLISHLVMLPFIFGLLFQIYNFIRHFIKNETHRILAFLLVIADPSLLSQLVQVTPEVLQLFFFFLALNALIDRNYILKGLGLAFLGIVSYRGTMLCIGVFFIDLFYVICISRSSFRSIFAWKNVLAYFFGALPAILFVSWHYFTKGWIKTYPDSTWASGWHFVDLKGFFRNIAILAHRYLDFNRFFILLPIVLALLFKPRWLLKNEIYRFLTISLTSVIVIIITSLLATNPMGHRYFITSYLVLALLTFKLILNLKAWKLIYSCILLLLISGNFIVYPDKIAQGWDASLAHLPYWDLRREMIDYMDENDIPVEQTASFFPNQVSIDEVELNGDQRRFGDFRQEMPFIFYSNVYNPSDQVIKDINSKYTMIKTLERCNVRVELWKKDSSP